MFCTNCGAPLPDEARFCTHCGTALSAAQPPQPAPAPVDGAEGEPVRKKSRKGLVVGLVVLVVVLAAIVAAVLLLKDGTTPLLQKGGSGSSSPAVSAPEDDADGAKSSDLESLLLAEAVRMAQLLGECAHSDYPQLLNLPESLYDYIEPMEEFRNHITSVSRCTDTAALLEQLVSADFDGDPDVLEAYGADAAGALLSSTAITLIGQYSGTEALATASSMQFSRSVQLPAALDAPELYIVRTEEYGLMAFVSVLPGSGRTATLLCTPIPWLEDPLGAELWLAENSDEDEAGDAEELLAYFEEHYDDLLSVWETYDSDAIETALEDSENISLALPGTDDTAAPDWYTARAAAALARVGETGEALLSLYTSAPEILAQASLYRRAAAGGAVSTQIGTLDLEELFDELYDDDLDDLDGDVATLALRRAYGSLPTAVSNQFGQTAVAANSILLSAGNLSVRAASTPLPEGFEPHVVLFELDDDCAAVVVFYDAGNNFLGTAISLTPDFDSCEDTLEDDFDFDPID